LKECEEPTTLFSGRYPGSLKNDGEHVWHCIFSYDRNELAPFLKRRTPEFDERSCITIRHTPYRHKGVVRIRNGANSFHLTPAEGSARHLEDSEFDAGTAGREPSHQAKTNFSTLFDPVTRNWILFEVAGLI